MDAEIQENVELALSSVLSVALNVRVNEGTVILEGAVENDADAMMAESLARQVEGVTQVINNLVVEPPEISLETLGERQSEIAGVENDTEAVEDGEPYFPAVEDGEPYFPPTDPVVWPSSRSEEGLEVRGGFAPDSLEEAFMPHTHETLRHGDDEITDEVSRALSLAAITADREIEVETVDGVVYLRGRVGSLDEAEEAEAIAATVPGVVEVNEELDIM